MNQLSEDPQTAQRTQQAADVAISVVRLLDREFPVDRFDPSIVATALRRVADSIEVLGTVGQTLPVDPPVETQPGNPPKTIGG